MHPSFSSLVLLSLLFLPRFAGTQINTPVHKEAQRIYFNLEPADTATRHPAHSIQYEPADTATAKELAHKAALWLASKQFTQARTAAEKAATIYAQLGIENEKSVFAWDALTKVCYFTENYNRALEACEASAAICWKIYPATHPKVLTSYNDLGVLYSRTGRHDKALEYLFKALELTLRQSDTCANRVINIYRNIGTEYMHTAQYAKALEYYEKGYQTAVQCNLEKTWDMVGIYCDLATSSGHIGDLYKPIEYLEKGASLAEQLGPPVNPAHIENVIDCYDNLGSAYGEVYQLDKAKQAYEKALNLKLKYWSANYISISNSYNNLASTLLGSGDYKNAARYHEKAIEVLSKSPQGSPEKLAYYYGNLALCFNHLGDRQRAIEMQEHALNLKISAFGPEHPAVTGSYHNLASALSETGEYEQALRYSHLAINTFIQSNTENHPDLVKYYMRAGEIYARMGNTPKATEHYRRALEIYTQVYRDAHPNMAIIFYNIGGLYAPGDDLEIAVGHIKRGIQINNDFYGPSGAELAAGYTLLGGVFHRAGHYTDAEQAFRSALNALNADNSSALNNPNAIEQLIATHTVVANFYQKKYRQTLDPALLTISRDHYTSALVALNRLSRSVSPASKSTLAAHAADICAGSIATDLLLRTHPNSLHAFDLAERSKAFVLFEAMKDADAMHIAGIPDSLLERERDLRLGIAFFEKRQQELRDSMLQKSDSLGIDLGSKLLDLKKRHETLIRFFEEKYPEYYQAKYGLATISVADVQAILRPGQTLLEYTIGDSTIFAFVVRPDHFSVHELPRDFPLEQTVDSLTRLGIYAYYTLPEGKRPPAVEKSSARNYTNAARLLYEKLVAPVAEHLTEELVIVPDGVLGYVPFEALLSGEPARRSVFSTYEPHFLLQRHRISYSYSATLLREMRDRRHRIEPQAGALALAPFFRQDTAALHARADSAGLFTLRDAFGPLAASGDEAYAVAKITGGSALYGPDASLDAFRQRAPQHRILHLSTHGKADDRLGDYAYLALGVPGDTTAFDKLYARDLYGIGLNADLVVLSACETTTGKLRRGEGIVSLARAFSFAGAKSLVTTLWKVNDRATKDLMLDFYGHLHDGQTKDVALWQAKRDFLAKTRDVDAGRLHPFFWAGVVAIGDMRPVK